MSSDKAIRRRLQFSLRAVLLVLTLLAIWFAVWTSRWQRQRRSVAAVTALGGKVAYAFEPGYDPRGKLLPLAKPAAPAWLRRVLGDDYFSGVTAVTFFNTGISNADLAPLAQLTELAARPRRQSPGRPDLHRKQRDADGDRRSPQLVVERRKAKSTSNRQFQVGRIVS